MGNKLITEAKTTKGKNYIFEQRISQKIVVLEITGEETGYTIQALKGIDYTFSDPAVIVKTYKVNILLRRLNKDRVKISDEVIDTFNVTRDSWYYLGNQKQANDGIVNEKLLLNREFVPDNYEQNQYTALWLPNFPAARAQHISRGIRNKAKYIHMDPPYEPDGLNAFKLTRFGSEKLPAKPLRTEKKLNGSTIDEPRINPNIATNVLIHIGGTYSIFGYDHLGGSYGCFGYTPKENIHSTVYKAKQASINDDYDDHLSNPSWIKICNKIVNLAFKDKLKIEIHLKQKSGETYVPKEILEE
ncbi:hypothetical protein BBH51_09325 [Aggregatibacter actinomycetemcomitans]|uniref:Uncharacterized protein n=2 Tax=Aggregatibacter actinomycetemcomitans TaxID=714 RepID=A0AAC8XZW9_AGGAC|nr:hypothetical protein [Aggregatibacter actinomycetemcomitans]AFI86532.1 hypothetical protein D7S_00715 [Aggregatibacter actinomycetemcomitans D7S-1]AMQ94664.1 hypothetical protein ACT75_09125 [Aggregatibacter actinomycetemcomitans]ANU82835.1 hypothetical protein BBH51_09325 [Aggregatibacter actinomycetemcomitans]EKX94044.1 hypothetical protein HMPREF9996_01996 [Aggregatibacter actinomycetemcomitans Y4]KND84289.1 hypothetical protein H5P1_0208025 [Aggregatibacter actinomycetemcomitans serotyp